MPSSQIIFSATTAPASPGSSGGPLLTRDGRVIGILTFGFKEGQNLNFAVPSNYVQAMLETLESHAPVAPLRVLTKLDASTHTHSEAGSADDSNKAKLNGTLFVAWRTDRHRAYSSSEVFRGIVDEVLLFLKQSRLKLANDDLGRSLQVEHAISIYEVTAAARKAGASHVLVLEVDRPLASWVKLRLQCLTVEGAELWQEEAKNSSWVKTGAGGAKAAMKEFKALVAKRLSGTPLPSDDPRPSKK